MIAIWSYITAAAILCGLAILVARHLSLWLQAYFTGTRISLLDLVLMSLRKSNPKAIVQCKVMAVQSGLATLSTSAIEAQYLAGGDVHRVTRALIAADRAGICLDWNTAAAIGTSVKSGWFSLPGQAFQLQDNRSDGGSERSGSRDGVAASVFTKP